MIVQQNWNELQKVDADLFTDTINFSEELGGIPFVHFPNKIISMIYTLIFDQELPKVTKMMIIYLQTGSKVTGDWFLHVENTEIRLYGFIVYPFLLPTFLTDRIFTLEFSRQRIHTEKKNIFLITIKGAILSFIILLALLQLRVAKLFKL